MSNDPAFLFYPGDYLRDTQILSEAAQVAYDRIMCEHMRNICIRQDQLKFLTKRLTNDERAELMHVLTEVDGGYQISWVAQSINKRRAYSESRRKNRTSKPKKDMSNISKTYVQHMENEIEIENVNNTKGAKPKNDAIVFPFDTPEFMEAWKAWKAYKREEHNFKYKSASTEQGALTQLSKLTDDPDQAVQIILQSIGNGWKGFFDLKTSNNGKHNGTAKKSVGQGIAEMLKQRGLA